ncbi:MAG: hypothetical protein EAZ97_14900, partial [Bacteroidetes bacterium]
SLDIDFRKQEGIFYSPNVLTEYIVNQVFKEYFYKKENIFEALQKVKILDPSCGTGAFLLQSFDYLSNFYQNHFPNIQNPKKWIVENNLYGVDIDENAVKICQNRLFEKSNFPCLNIKIGNSLIDDKTVDAKAFDWQKEFPKTVGGFDLIVGNPPYVSTKMIADQWKKYFSANYQVAKDQFDLYALFIEKAIFLLKEGGNHCFIVPDSLLGRSNFKEIRKKLLHETNLKKIFHLNNVFEEAVVSSCVYFCQKTEEEPTLIYTKTQDLLSWQNKNLQTYTIEKTKIKRNGHKILAIHNKEYDLLYKICNHSELGLITYSWRGEEIGKKSDILAQKKESTNVGILTGENVGRYVFKNENNFINKENITKNLSNYEKNKIVVRQLGDFISANLDTEGHISTQAVYNIFPEDPNYDLLYILALLNSKLIHFVFQRLYAEKKAFPRILLENLRDLPIPNISLEDQKPFADKAKKLVEKNKDLQKLLAKFLKLIQTEFKISKITQKIENWHKLNFVNFIEELKKQKLAISKKQIFDFMDIFEEKRADSQSLLSEIDFLEKELNLLIYNLYNLSAEEIKMVENE